LPPLQELLDNWLACQATWQYLEPIFSSPDILKQMPLEGERFQVRAGQHASRPAADAVLASACPSSCHRGAAASTTASTVAPQEVDTTWRELMESARASPGCLVLAAQQERLAALELNNRLLDEIQKVGAISGASLPHGQPGATRPAACAAGGTQGRRPPPDLHLCVSAYLPLHRLAQGLAAYLELKRLAFPRFFFLSNDEMLEILSETKDASRVQPHLKKCFEGIDRLRFENNGDITGARRGARRSCPFIVTSAARRDTVRLSPDGVPCRHVLSLLQACCRWRASWCRSRPRSGRRRRPAPWRGGWCRWAAGAWKQQAAACQWLPPRCTDLTA
jgi:dynein heavy chain